MNINFDLAKKLIVNYPIRQGCLFGVNIHKDELSWAAKNQMDFLYKLLLDIKPKNIVEIGTHCGFFSIFLKGILDYDFILHTFSIDPKSEKCVNMINNEYDNFINFYLGDSKETFTAFNKNNIEFVWVDGGHTREDLYKDLQNVDRLNIEHICIDDVNNNTVKKTVMDFINDYGYEIISQSDDVKPSEKWKGIYYIKKK